MRRLINKQTKNKVRLCRKQKYCAIWIDMKAKEARLWNWNHNPSLTLKLYRQNKGE